MGSIIGNIVGFLLAVWLVPAIFYGIYLSIKKDPDGPSKAFSWPITVYKHFLG